MYAGDMACNVSDSRMDLQQFCPDSGRKSHCWCKRGEAAIAEPVFRGPVFRGPVAEPDRRQALRRSSCGPRSPSNGSPHPVREGGSVGERLERIEPPPECFEFPSDS